MSNRLYVSNISSLWPIERQLAVVGGDFAQTFTDELDAKSRRTKRADVLTSRALMLRPTSRRAGETITVAALPCLAFGTDDFLDVLTKAADRGAAISVREPKMLFPPDKRHTATQRAAKAFAKAKEDAHALSRGKIGGAVAGQRRAAETKAKALSVEQQWGNLDYTIAQLAELSGVSRNSLKKYLGDWDKAQLKYVARERRKAKA